jgi:amidase
MPMKRRKFIQAGATAGLSFVVLGSYSCKNDSPALESETTNASPEFALQEVTIDELQKKMERGEYSSRSITEMYLKQIEAIDKNGPVLNSIIELNPDALTIATSLIREKGWKIRKMMEYLCS